jgi:hypothetical protein
MRSVNRERVFAGPNKRSTATVEPFAIVIAFAGSLPGPNPSVSAGLSLTLGVSRAREDVAGQAPDRYDAARLLEAAQAEAAGIWQVKRMK